jgi:dTDP-glucose pyrophosphorylase
MNKPILVILAAGMGSRYGGLKQLAICTSEGDTLIDFSIYDALQAGFGKFVFIIRKSFENEFKEIYNKKLAGRAEVAYVFQELNAVPKKYRSLERTKPWGTGHALLMAKELVKENFAIINGDDFYGKEAFSVMAKYLAKKDKNSYHFSMMAYVLKNTLSDFGAVSRGACQIDKDGNLQAVIECTHIEKSNGELMQKDAAGKMIPIDENTVVSMNFWGFTPKYFEFGAQLFNTFLADNKENLKAEFYIPTVVNEILKSKKTNVEVLKSDAKWFGVTYKEDKIRVQKTLQNLKESGTYPKKLW